MEANEDERFPLIDAIDHEILMHRDAHFGGQFSIMLDYYKQEGKGTQADFDIQRIEKLAELESQLKENLAALFLASNEAERVAEAREAYRKLREIYEIKKPKTPYARLIADLILSEDEEAKAEIAAIVSEKDKMVPALIELLRSEELYDPLFPGYGQAPFLAVKALEKIGDKRAIISLFEAIGQGDFFEDEQIVKALKAIGNPAKEFLRHVVSGVPINEDNEKAAIALIAFKEDEEVANLCFDLLQRSDIQKDPCLTTYLVLCCAGLKDPLKRKTLQEMSINPLLPSLFKEDLKGIIHEWEKEG